jgi:hypothetical protein
MPLGRRQSRPTNAVPFAQIPLLACPAVLKKMRIFVKSWHDNLT